MKKYVVLGIGLCVAFAFTSCKSSESAYKKAYEKAKQQELQETPRTDESEKQVDTTPVTPVTPVTPANTNHDNVSVRQEKVEIISGAGLKGYSVVCGSFSLKANAEGLQSTLKGKGYEAQIAYNSANRMYRVVASTFTEKGAAVQSRDQLRADYPDAWLLFNK